jgi:hypothetical protein
MTKEAYAGWLARAEKGEPVACDIVAKPVPSLTTR